MFTCVPLGEAMEALGALVYPKRLQTILSATLLDRASAAALWTRRRRFASGGDWHGPGWLGGRTNGLDQEREWNLEGSVGPLFPTAR